MWANDGQVVLLTDVHLEGGYWEQKITLGTIKGKVLNDIVPKFVNKYFKDYPK